MTLEPATLEPATLDPRPPRRGRRRRSAASRPSHFGSSGRPAVGHEAVCVTCEWVLTRPVCHRGQQARKLQETWGNHWTQVQPNATDCERDWNCRCRPSGKHQETWGNVWTPAQPNATDCGRDWVRCRPIRKVQEPGETIGYNCHRVQPSVNGTGPVGAHLSVPRRMMYACGSAKPT